MYCVKCGVELADSQRVCPLCGTRVFHPDIPRKTALRRQEQGRQRKFSFPVFQSNPSLPSLCSVGKRIPYCVLFCSMVCYWHRRRTAICSKSP